jgi:calcium-dependent protein kinase
VSATRANNPEPGLGRGVQRITSNAFLYYHLANEPITDQYDLKEKLGEPGGYGYAQVAIKKKTKEKFAVKVINKVKFHRDHDSKRDMFYREMQIMKELDHPNVIKGYDMFEDDQNLYLVMELCRGGELFDVLNSRFQNNQTFSEVDASGILRQICMGIKHLHDNKIAHCDLKPDNFLFKDKDHKVIKIIDFNLAKYTKNLEYLDATCGTKYYMAPEVLNQKFTYHCDMWSFGVVMYLMLFGRPPFQGKNYQSIQKKIKAGFTPAVQTGKGPWFPQDIPVSREAKDLIAGLLDSNFSTRLTAAEALEHPWLRGEAPNTPMVTNVVNNLASFMATSSFKTQLLRLMARDFSDPELDDLKSCFEMIDTNGDGFLTISELKAALLEAGVSQTVLQTVLCACSYSFRLLFSGHGGYAKIVGNGERSSGR